MVNHSVALKDLMYHIPGLFERPLVSQMKEIAVRFHLTIMCKINNFDGNVNKADV